VKESADRETKPEAAGIAANANASGKRRMLSKRAASRPICPVRVRPGMARCLWPVFVRESGDRISADRRCAFQGSRAAHRILHFVRRDSKTRKHKSEVRRPHFINGEEDNAFDDA